MELTLAQIPLVAANPSEWVSFPGFIDEIVAQFNKDLALAGAPYEMNAQNPNELLENISSLCGHLGESNGEQLASLLYRIDLKPEDLPFHGNELEGKDLAMVILKREAMKVLFRKYYSG